MALNDEFFGRVGHDLRGELATMLAGVHYLLRYESDLGPTAREMLDRINGAGQRLKRLLDEFGNCVWLDGSAERELVRERCDVRALCSSAVERIARAAAGRDVTPVVEVASMSLDADAEIVTTALEYVLELCVTRSRNQSVSVRGGVEAGRAIVRIADEAGRVPEEQVACILEPFAEKQAIPKETPARRRERLGLGLSIARGMLAAHGGKLEVRAAPAGIEFLCDLGPVV